MSLDRETLETLQQSQELIEIYRDGIRAESLQGVVPAQPMISFT